MQYNSSTLGFCRIAQGALLTLALGAMAAPAAAGTVPSNAVAQLVDGRTPGQTRLPNLDQPLSQDGLSAPGTRPGAGLGTPPFADEDYLLGGGDLLQVTFFNVPELSGSFQVLPNGTVNLPQMGAVPVRGLTLNSAEAAISQKASALLRYPVVTVSLEQARPITVAIAGEVTSPGSFTLRPGDGTTAGTIPSLTETLKLAQGVTQSGDLSRVQIRRPNGFSRSGSVVTVDLWELVRSGDISQDLRLRDGDSVFVPPTDSIDLERAWQMSDIAFATPPERPMQISIVGEVNRPGPYTLTGESFRNPEGNTVTLQVPTITRAIQAAGGITQAADVRNIVLKRTTRTGPEQQLKVDFWKLLKDGDFRQDVPLQDGDTIAIMEASEINDSEITEVATASFSPDQITVMIAGEVESPGPVQLAPNTPMNQALLAAGGFNNRAKRNEITLMRLNPNGSVTKRDVNIDFAAGVNSDLNPAMRNGDTLVVGRSGFSTAVEVIGDVTRPFTNIFSIFRLFGIDPSEDDDN